jgi:DNA processing protein
MPPGQAPFRWSFPARNRIMAGLAEMTVVVEAAERSGSLITADFAQDLGRAVGGVPGRITARRSDGSNALLRDGARVVLGVEDILDELFHAGAVERPPRPGGGAKGPAPGDPELSAVLQALEAEDHVDGVVRRTRLPAARVRALLARLESMGYVRRRGLGGFQRSA